MGRRELDHDRDGLVNDRGRGYDDGRGRLCNDGRSDGRRELRVGDLVEVGRQLLNVERDIGRGRSRPGSEVSSWSLLPFESSSFSPLQLGDHHQREGAEDGLAPLQLQLGPLGLRRGRRLVGGCSALGRSWTARSRRRSASSAITFPL
jgi:hypothetical protein